MNIGAVLIDVDGVLHVGDRQVAGADRALRELDRRGIPYRFVSSTTRSSRHSVAQRLHHLGYEIPEPWIVTAPVAAAVHLRESGRTRCCLLTTPDARTDLEENGISVVDGGADAVVVGDAGGALTCERLNRAFRLLMEGANVIALEKDRYWMGGDGLMLSAGPVVAAPSRDGDEIVTDIGGARGCGMMGILVRTGKYREEAVRRSGITPDLVIDSLADPPDHI